MCKSTIEPIVFENGVMEAVQCIGTTLASARGDYSSIDVADMLASIVASTIDMVAQAQYGRSVPKVGDLCRSELDELGKFLHGMIGKTFTACERIGTDFNIMG